MSIVLTGLKNSKSLKYRVNDEPGFITDLSYSTKILLKKLTKSQFAHNLKNGSDIYDYVNVLKSCSL